jgi:protein-disulfide isomerase
MENTPETSENLTKKERKELKRQQKVLSREELKVAEDRKRMFTWGVATLLLLAAATLIILFARSGRPSGILKPVDANDWTRGNKNAPAVLVDYSDFQCPSCAAYYPILKKLENDVGPEKLLFVYRNFPLTMIHKNAQLAAQSAEAAGKQGKFWEMHDKLFENQSAWSELADPKNTFVAYAADLKLNKDQFEKDLTSDEVVKSVQEDIDSGNEARVDATPTFFLNGQPLPLTSNYEQLKGLVEAAATTTTAK